MNMKCNSVLLNHESMDPHVNVLEHTSGTLISHQNVNLSKVYDLTTGVLLIVVMIGIVLFSPFFSQRIH